jgi:hypothetical protein
MNDTKIIFKAIGNTYALRNRWSRGDFYCINNKFLKIL